MHNIIIAKTEKWHGRCLLRPHIFYQKYKIDLTLLILLFIISILIRNNSFLWDGTQTSKMSKISISSSNSINFQSRHLWDLAI